MTLSNVEGVLGTNGCGRLFDGERIGFVQQRVSIRVVLGWLPISLAQRLFGVLERLTARMRFDEVNAKGGVHGRQIQYVVEDTSYQVPKAMSAANKLVNRDGVIANLMGVGTPLNNAIMPMLFESGVLNLFPISGGRQMVNLSIL